MRIFFLVILSALLPWGQARFEGRKASAFPSVVASSFDGAGGGMQVMITRRMRKVLVDDLGYLTSEVDVMEPSVAAVVIERGLARPSNGMPASWRRTANPVSKSESKNVVVRLIDAALNFTRGLARGLVQVVGIASSKTLSLAALLVVVPFCYNVVTSDGGFTIENIDKAAQNTKEVLGAGAVGVEKGVKKGKAFVKGKISDNKGSQKKSGLSFPSSSKPSRARTGAGSGRRLITTKPAAARVSKSEKDSKPSTEPPVPFAGSAKSMSADNKHKGGTDRLDIESYESVMDSQSPLEKARINMGKLQNSIFSSK